MNGYHCNGVTNAMGEEMKNFSKANGGDAHENRHISKLGGNKYGKLEK